ncbi:hypothetical protein [Desmospora profundinema]|uniref:Uncharacterized protein n=1 Tax=Desmospora profundinema TaxID=1571184 RepID=A0ABU1II22_9BACL|nr:hypothetical protein [Desmospora profundinema]MDR6224417.1 hypothetical protein [Desmospora profundinema]
MLRDVIRTMGVALAFAFFVSFAFLSPALAIKMTDKPIITVSVRSSSTAAFESKMELSNAEMTKAWRKAQKKKADVPFSLTDIYVTIRQAGQERHFRMESSGTLWDETTRERLILPKKTAKKLQSYGRKLRGHHYGKLIPWKEAKYILPKKHMFTVLDLETGLSFRVQRRAGSKHADVQPLTKQDTKIMKQIYHNRWSWNRKAILVHSGKEWLAASMNGMPHGGGGIRNNGFSGHFCIHFSGSTTHRSKDPDLTHQLMINKAAGNVRVFLRSATPQMLAESFIEALSHQDSEILQLLSEGLTREKQDFFMREMKRLTFIRSKKQTGATNEKISADLLFTEVRLPVTLYRDRKKQNTTYLFLLSRISDQSPWCIQDILTDEIQSDRKKE